MYDVVTNNLIIREWLNGSLFPLSGNLAFIIGVYLIQTYTDTRDIARWRANEGVQVACGLFWVFSMETVRAGWIWLILRFTNDVGNVPDWVRVWSNYSFIFAASILMATMIWCTFLFSPPRWRSFFWKFSVVTTTAFLLLSHYIPATGSF